MNVSPPASSDPRPPTPPKERAIDQALDGFIQYLDESSKLQTVPATSFDTPPPSSSPTLPATLPQTNIKKIRFVSQPSLIDSPSTDTTQLNAPSPLRPLPPSRYQRSRRSILKSYESSSPPPSSDDAEISLSNASVADYGSFKDLFAAVVKGLESQAYAVRINAYQLLLRSLRQSRNIPDPQAVSPDLPLLENVLQQDMVATSPATSGPDAKLISQATRLTANLLYDPKMSSQLSSKFVDFVMDRCLEVAEAPKLPKEVFKNQLFLLSIDRLLAGALTPAKATRLIAALSTISERVSGDHILSIRLTILRELARYAPATLTASAQEWPAWIFQGIMSSSLEVRSVAITTGAMLSTKLGASKHVSHGIKDFFEGQAFGSGTNFDVFYNFLEQLLLGDDDAHRVPGIWSIVVLFLRGSSLSLASWSRLNQWFKIIQNCLNSADVKLNMEAWIAWNNLVFAVNPSLTTPAYMRNILIKPIVSKLQLHAKTEIARRNRQAAFSSFSLLLYYAFRPGCSSEHITLYWSAFVMEVVQNARMTSRQDVDRLCDILCALLSNPENTAWDVNRYAPSCVEPVKANEIPRIDPAWTRSNIDVATEVVEHFVAMQLPLQAQHKFAQRIWRSLLKAVTEAGSREIKPSLGLKRAIAEVLNLFARLTKRITLGTIRASSPDLALDCICDMADAVRCIQPTNFTERSLFRSENGTFHVVQSPPTSNSKTSGQPQSPLVALLEMMSPLAQAAKPDSDGLRALESLITASIENLSSRKTKILFLKSCADAIYAGGTAPHEASHHTLWIHISKTLQLTLDEVKQDLSLREHGQSLYEEYEASLSMIKKGLDMTGKENCQSLAAAISRLIMTAKAEAGDAATLISIVAPLSLAIICCRPNSSLDAYLSAGSVMLRANLVAPSDRTIMSAARFMLPRGQQATNWSFALFNMTNRLLHDAPRRDDLDAGHLTNFMNALTEFSRAPLCAEPNELLIQCHIGLSQCAKKAKSLPEAFPHLWSRFMAMLKFSVLRDSRSLKLHEVLFIAGFTSDSRNIAYSAIETWNSTFGLCQDIAYSSRLSELLNSLKGIAHVLSSDAAMNCESSSQSLDTKDKLSEIFPWTATDESEVLECFAISTPKALQRGVDKPRSLRIARQVQTTPLPSTGLPTKKAQKTAAKLRHDNSQIDFVPITSVSPLGNENTSQHLTEHQVEVRSRQEQENALFAELKSTPMKATNSFNEKSVHSPTNDVDVVSSSPSQERSRRRAKKQMQRRKNRALAANGTTKQEDDAGPISSMESGKLSLNTSLNWHDSTSDNDIDGKGIAADQIPSSPSSFSSTSSIDVSELHSSRRSSRQKMKSSPQPKDADNARGVVAPNTRRASLRANQASQSSAGPASTESSSKKRKSTAVEENKQDKRKKSNPNSEIDLIKSDSSEAHKSNEINAEAHLDHSSQRRSTRSNPNPSTEPVKSHRPDAPVRKSERRRTRSKAAMDMDMENTMKRRKSEKTGDDQVVQPSATDNVDPVEPLPETATLKRTRSSNGRFSATMPERRLNEEPVAEDAQTETTTTHDLNDEDYDNGDASANNSTSTESVHTPTSPRIRYNLGSPISPPSRLSFSPAMSAKARMFLDGMKEMYRQCKALVLGQDDQGMMDEMEDVVDNVRREIGRAGRRGGLANHSSSQP